VRAAYRPNLRLPNVANAIHRILDYTASHTLESFAVDGMTVDAVVRNLEVIAEAARHVDAKTGSRTADVPWQETSTRHPQHTERIALLCSRKGTGSVSLRVLNWMPTSAVTVSRATWPE
jgi:hypothetical protein